MPSFLPSFPSTNFYRPLSLNRVLLFPRWSFYARRGRKRRKKSRGRKNHGEAISRKRPSVTCHSRDYTIIAFPFHDQIYEYEMRTIFFNKCEFPPCSQIIIQTRRIGRNGFALRVSIKRNHDENSKHVSISSTRLWIEIVELNFS